MHNENKWQAETVTGSVTPLALGQSHGCHDPIVVIFFRGCVPELVVPSYAVGFIYRSRDSWVLFPLLMCSLMMCTINRVNYSQMVVLVCLHITLPHYHHYAYVSWGIKLQNACQVHSVKCVSKIKSILLVLFHAICGAVFIELILWLWEYVYFILSSSSSLNRKYDPFATV